MAKTNKNIASDPVQTKVSGLNTVDQSHNTAQKRAKLLYLVTIISIVIAVLALAFVFTRLNNNQSDRQTGVNITQTESLPSVSQQNPELEKSRTELDSFLQTFNSNGDFDPATVAYSPQFQKYQIKPGGKYKVEIEYGSVGDQKMNEASLFIKLADSLKVVENTMKDDFIGKGMQSVDGQLFNSETNSITYGPGSYNQTKSVLDLAQFGKFELQVQMSEQAKAGELVRLYSYVSEPGQNKGKIDVIFFEVI